jgi:hypothetical protein
MPTFTRTIFVSLLLALVTLAFAHETKIVGEEGGEQYKVIVGFTQEPPFTEQRNGLDLIIRTMDDKPVEGLVGAIMAEITSPDGMHTRTFKLRARHGMPGRYTDDILLSEPGVYTIRIWGFIGGVEFDETFETHEVRPLDDLRFP